jgi:lipopolysaccharide transport system ATP-binding protein
MKEINKQTTIAVQGLGKAFTIQNKKSEQIKEILGMKARRDKKHWALKDINFELKKGEAIGVVGRNGSGKSTLLQLICGTLKATEGKIITNGKIAALLELGSGFNPEFTGKENIYLNATLLGLKKKEIDNNLDKIKEFADIGDYINQPIRTYSSGMIVRLAFAVMAHVNADILIIDEALAVGDAYFTQKCMRFIQRIREEKSLMFVSHDANAILSLCDKAILLDKGIMTKIGTPKNVMEEYTRGLQKEMESNSLYINTKDNNKVHNDKEVRDQWTSGDTDTYKSKWQDYRSKYVNQTVLANKLLIKKFNEHELQSEDYGGNIAKIQSVNLKNIEINKNTNIIIGGEIACLEIVVSAHDKIKNPIVGFLLKNDKGITLLGDNSYNNIELEKIKNLEKGMKLRVRFIFTIPILPSGEYSISASIADGNQKQHKILHWKNDAIVLQSLCSSVAAGVAGVAMHSILIETI